MTDNVVLEFPSPAQRDWEAVERSLLATLQAAGLRHAADWIINDMKPRYLFVQGEDFFHYGGPADGLVPALKVYLDAYSARVMEQLATLEWELYEAKHA